MIDRTENGCSYGLWEYVLNADGTITHKLQEDHFTCLSKPSAIASALL